MIQIHDEVISPSFVANFQFLTQDQNNWINEVLFQLQGAGWVFSEVTVRNHSFGYFDPTVTFYHPQLGLFNRRMITGDPIEAAKEIYDIGKQHRIHASSDYCTPIEHLQLKFTIDQPICNHEFVNVSFNHLKMACKHCGQDM